MARPIKFVCRAEHPIRERESQLVPVLTVYQGDWAYCPRGGEDGHTWSAVAPPLPIEEIRLIAGGELV